jgi:hypothetical protein
LQVFDVDNDSWKDSISKASVELDKALKLVERATAKGFEVGGDVNTAWGKRLESALADRQQ